MSYPRYPAYKDSGVEWLGDIPSHWNIRRLKHLSKLNPQRSELRDVSQELEVSFLPMEHVGEDGSLNLAINRPLADLESGYTYCRDGDVIVAKITPCFENGKGALCRNLTNGIALASTEFHVIRPTDDVIPEFIFAWTQSPIFRDQGIATMYGAGGQKRVPIEFLENFLFIFPSVAEQQCIVSFLDHETAHIDGLVAKQEQLIALLQEKRKVIISHAVTRGLEPDVTLKESGIEWLGMVPVHWGISTLGSVTDVIDPNPSHRNPIYVDDGYPFISTVEFIGTDEILLDSSRRVAEATVIEQEKRCSFKEGSIAFSRKGTLGSVRVLPHDVRFALLDSVCIINCKDTLTYNYMYRQLQSTVLAAQLEGATRGAALKQISVGRVRGLRVLIPPLNEQIAIINFLSKEIAKLDALINKALSVIDLLKEHRASLISAAVTGKIDVRGFVARAEEH
jgi:type I restriction enzyme, S subunit